MRRGLVLVVVAVACSRRQPDASEAFVASRDAAPPRASDAGAAGDSTVLRPALEGFPPQLELIGPAGAAAKLGVVAVPLGAREPRPLMLALHGGSDRPEWACNAWRGITGGYPILVCPRGVGASEASLAWSSPADTKSRIAQAIAATKTILGAWVRETDTIVLAGFSMGATQAALLAQSDPATYRRLVLAESAYAPEPAMAFAKPWATGGGQRAIFLCTTRGCEGPYRSAARNVARQGGRARLDIAGTNQHGMWDVVVQSMRRDWPWLVEGAEGWERYAPPLEEGALPGKTETFDPP
ncbi:MAG TPA: alpha/beta hydrolase [Labilithrix sp.]|nr:alpha/beta hydrolase [Labilithrix sp.]